MCINKKPILFKEEKIMGFLERGAEYVNNQYNKSLKGIEKNYTEKLRKSSDSVVMSKLQQAEREGHYLYDVTLKEAKKRGLV